MTTIRFRQFLLLVVCFCINPFRADARYFLSMKEKGELLLTGCVTDQSGNHYDVRIIPGYRSMLDFIGGQWVQGWNMEYCGGVVFSKGLVRIPVSVRYLGDYVSKKPWTGIAEGASQTYLVETFLLTDFLWSGVGGTWREYWKYAHEAHRRQSFGWWFAYPWACIKGTVNTALRYATGTAGIVGVAAYGTVLRPAYELSLPVVKTGYEATKQTVIMTSGVARASWGLAANQLLLGVAMPISGYVWTTAIGAPMALIGKAPTPESADGWWVVLVNTPERDSAGPINERPADGPDGNTFEQLPSRPLDTALIEEIINLQTGIIEYQRAWRQAQSRRDSTIDSLYAQAARVRDHYQEIRDSLYQDCVGRRDCASLPAVPDSARWPYQRKTKLISALEKYFNARGDTAFTPGEKALVIRIIADYLTMYEISTEQAGKRRFSKDPNKILQDELEQIFGPQ